MTVLFFSITLSLLIQVLLFVHDDAKLTYGSCVLYVVQCWLIIKLHEILCMFLVTDRPQTYEGELI